MGKWYSTRKVVKLVSICWKSCEKLGYKLTHIGIQSKSFCSGKILTVARKKKDILASIADGEKPLSLSCYSLPKDYRIASFDYDFYVFVRKNIFRLSWRRMIIVSLTVKVLFLNWKNILITIMVRYI